MENQEREMTLRFYREAAQGEVASPTPNPPTAASTGPQSQSILRIDPQTQWTTSAESPAYESGTLVEGTIGSTECGKESCDTKNTVDRIAATEVVESLLKAAHVLRGVLSDHFAEFGLSDVRYTVMRTIQNAAESGCSQADLAEYLQQSESSISTLIDRMRSDNLLYRLPSTTDRRKKVLKLSDRGRELLGAIAACHEERMRNLLEQINWDVQAGFDSEICSVASQLVHLNRDGRLLQQIREVRSAPDPVQESEGYWRRSA